jgi:hypothetical protein
VGGRKARSLVMLLVTMILIGVISFVAMLGFVKLCEKV